MIEVVRLRPDDWRSWRELRLQALTEDAPAFGSSLAEWSGPGDTEERWRARLTNVPLNALVYWDGQLAGMVGAMVNEQGDHSTVELISLWIAPFARGHGVSDAAVEAVREWARREHPGLSVTLAVKANNRPAIDLYRRHGFAEIGPSPDSPDEILMRADPLPRLAGRST